MKFDGLNEPRLEQEFFGPLKRELQTIHDARRVEVLKPVPSQEAFVGFDLGYVHQRPDDSDGSVLTHNQLLQRLADEIRSGPESRAWYFAYFLQFKVVERMVTRSKNLPAGFRTPYHRAHVDLRLRENGMSQHEMLLRLAQRDRAEVYYACPMVFDLAQLEPEARLEDLVLVDVRSAPPLWKDDEEHFIAFQDPGPPPVWCSDPTPGRATPVRALLERPGRPPEEFSVWLDELRRDYQRLVRGAQSRNGTREEGGKRIGFPPSLAILRASVDERLPPLFAGQERGRQ